MKNDNEKQVEDDVEERWDILESGIKVEKLRTTTKLTRNPLSTGPGRARTNVYTNRTLGWFFVPAAGKREWSAARFDWPCPCSSYGYGHGSKENDPKEPKRCHILDCRPSEPNTVRHTVSALPTAGIFTVTATCQQSETYFPWLRCWRANVQLKT
jgi:hypothetical protein